MPWIVDDAGVIGPGDIDISNGGRTHLSARCVAAGAARQRSTHANPDKANEGKARQGVAGHVSLPWALKAARQE